MATSRNDRPRQPKGTRGGGEFAVTKHPDPTVVLDETRSRRGRKGSLMADRASDVADVLASYLPGLRLLREYDEGHVAVAQETAPKWGLTLEEAREVMGRVAKEFPDDNYFGHDPTGKLDGTIAAVYQGFGGQDIYPSTEQKAANLLYLVVKDHALADGNKRSGVARHPHASSHPLRASELRLPG